MDEISTLLPSFPEEDGRVTKWTALALKSRSMLYAASVANFGSEQNNGLLGFPQSEASSYYQASLNASKEIIQSGSFSLYKKSNDLVKNFGDLFIDQNNNSNIWLGTGENVGGRHVGIGKGVFVSFNGGKTWENKGLKKSEHISKIIVNKDDSNTILVASQGPLWSSGGERGLYKSTDGGNNWRSVLKVDKWTGVTDIIVDNRDQNIVYAATWQRHRNVAAYMGGGPGTKIYKSTDGGDTWKQLKVGLPSGNLGKIGLSLIHI